MVRLVIPNFHLSNNRPVGSMNGACVVTPRGAALDAAGLVVVAEDRTVEKRAICKRSLTGRVC